MMLAWALTIAVSPCASVADDKPALDYDEINQRIEQGELSPEDIAKLIDIGERIKARAKQHLTFYERIRRALFNPWVVFGFLAQFAFMMRFVVQLVASERKKRSYIPVAFWYLSLAGGTMLFVYALKLRDPVFVFGQGLGCFIYVRNLTLIYRRKEAHRELRDLRQNRVPQNETSAGGELIDPNPATPPEMPET